MTKGSSLFFQKDPVYKPLMVGSFGVHMVVDEDVSVLRFTALIAETILRPLLHPIPC